VAEANGLQERKESLERQPGRRISEPSENEPSRRKGEGSERSTDLHAGKIPEGESLEAFFALTGEANRLAIKR
jgi:hypothetical protein